MVTPTGPILLVDEQLCRQHIRQMIDKAQRNDCVFRPHFKTHDNTTIGGWFRDEGVSKITVSSLDMARKFANDGWTNIFVAVPVNINELDKINTLARTTRLTVLVDSAEVAEIVSKQGEGLYVRIEIDAGYHRTGIDYTEGESIQLCMHHIGNGRAVTFDGFSAHAGNSYASKSRDEIALVHEQHRQRLSTLSLEYGTTLSVGDTPTCSTQEDFSWATEIRPGNFIFYDLMQVGIGSCNLEDVSVVVRCPVISKNESRGEVVVHGGAVHFSKEHLNWHEEQCFGKVKNSDAILSGLSQEHGKITGLDLSRVHIGEYLDIIPVHSCLAANLLAVCTSAFELLKS